MSEQAENLIQVHMSMPANDYINSGGTFMVELLALFQMKMYSFVFTFLVYQYQ